MIVIRLKCNFPSLVFWLTWFPDSLPCCFTLKVSTMTQAIFFTIPPFLSPSFKYRSFSYHHPPNIQIAECSIVYLRQHCWPERVFKGCVTLSDSNRKNRLRITQGKLYNYATKPLPLHAESDMLHAWLIFKNLALCCTNMLRNV